MSSGWEDFPVGRTITTPTISVTETHLVQFSSLTGDWYPLHTDIEYSKKSPFGQRIAHGPLTFAFAVGLMYQSQAYGDAILAFLGADNVRASAPVFIGDTIHVVATVTNSRASKDPERGIVGLKYVVKNQREEEVMSFDFTLLFRSRDNAS